MRKEFGILMLILVLLFFGGVLTLADLNPFSTSGRDDLDSEGREVIDLPKADYKGMKVEKALGERRSIREYKNEPLTKKQLAQILWAAQGITDVERGFRTAPSAGALYPLEVYLDLKNVEGLKEGIYKYKPKEEQLTKLDAESKREQIYQAALSQTPVKEAPVLVIFTGVYERSKAKYGEKGVKYTRMEVGHAAQNVYLQATSLGLGTVSIGAFESSKIKKILGAEGKPLYLMPVGKPNK